MFDINIYFGLCNLVECVDIKGNCEKWKKKKWFKKWCKKDKPNRYFGDITLMAACTKSCEGCKGTNILTACRRSELNLWYKQKYFPTRHKKNSHILF